MEDGVSWVVAGGENYRGEGAKSVVIYELADARTETKAHHEQYNNRREKIEDHE